MSRSDPEAWIDALADPAAYPHPVRSVTRVSTHASWVFLTGEYAYKVKRPVDYGFLDYSTLERRERFCREEVRLNRRFAPSLYLGVVPIRRSAGGEVRIDGPGETIEYAVAMRQFPERDLLAEVARRGELTRSMLEPLVETLVDVHAGAAAPPPGSPWGTPPEVRRWVDENFRHLDDPTGARGERVRRLASWCASEFSRIEPTLEQRRAAGRVREGHGDLHLGNVVLLDGRPTPFDGIEFEPSLRFVDIANDLAFLFTDVIDRGYEPLAWRLLDTYLVTTGDDEALEVLRYYAVYRALVRAKVAHLRERADPAHADTARREAEEYLALADRLAHERRRLIAITTGVSGSGKSHLADRLVEPLGAIRVRSDVERKRLFGYGPLDATPPERRAEIYSADATRRTYDRLAELARRAARCGVPIVVDAAFLRRAERKRFAELARELGAGFAILAPKVPPDELRRRVRSRLASGADPSEADEEVLDLQLRIAEPLDAEERAVALTGEAAEIVAELRARVAGCGR